MISFKKHIVQNVALKPIMSDVEINLFNSYLDITKNYLEYGCGGSTYIASLRPTINYMASVEGLQSWITKCKKATPIKTAVESGKLVFHHIDYNASDHYSYPTDSTKSNMFPKYSDVITSYPPNTFDMILIDGRFRVACTCKAYDYIGANTNILIHDYSIRSYYSIVEKFFTVKGIEDTFAVLQKKDDIDRNELEECITKYEMIPE